MISNLIQPINMFSQLNHEEKKLARPVKLILGYRLKVIKPKSRKM